MQRLIKYSPHDDSIYLLSHVSRNHSALSSRCALYWRARLLFLWVRHKLWSITLADDTGSDMSSNVGLSTPRGSGTSGYVQRNLSHLKPRDSAQPYPKDYDTIKNRQRQPDKEILEHDRKREIEVKVFELRDKLEDEG